MDDLDRALARLAGAPAPVALEGIEDHVLARIGTRPTVRETGLGIAAVTIAALAIGMIGAELPATASPVSFAPLGDTSPFAPSSLLIGEP